jgi:hypothetical protein
MDDEGPVIVHTDAALQNGYYGLGMYVEGCVFKASTGGRAEPGKDATYYEEKAIEFAIEKCHEWGINSAVIYTDNMFAVCYPTNDEKFEIHHTRDSLAHPAAKEGMRNARVRVACEEAQQDSGKSCQAGQMPT